ncbi:ATP-binding protein [Nereida sp. MMG025]|uniref:ATP-binding protein n=1 Tax=Nereida sp. MMG025 TaxID=2909981 RepID=UPI001F3EB8C5|nr:ATP-binding protein [Nereida sp. MMG025]MCF6444812.1 ATP-binding protein [Nereida sp. MMG025]
MIHEPFRTRFAADETAVRRALALLLVELRNHPNCDRGACEIVVAEVLNNIVEHACNGGEDGWIELCFAANETATLFTVSDNGVPMPDLRLPPLKNPIIDGAVGDLPEGGFGWALIHTLTQTLTYKRTAGVNTLTFEIAAYSMSE